MAEFPWKQAKSTCSARTFTQLGACVIKGMRKLVTWRVPIVRKCPQPMDRITFRVAALVATALLAIACSDARADTGDPASDPAQATSAATATSVQDTSSQASSQGEGGGAVATPSGDTSIPRVTPDPAPVQTPPVQEEIGPNPSLTITPPTTPASGQDTVPITPPSRSGPGDPAPQRLNETPPAPSAPAADQASAFAPGASGGEPSTAQAPEPGATAPVSVPAPIKPSPLAVVSTASAATQPGDGLEQLLTEVGRRLHDVQGKIGDLRHRLAEGTPPPKSRLIGLRTSLVRIAPMLAALEASLDAAGRLSPHLRQLLDRVSGDLRGVRVTAAGLITALQQSGARGAEVRLFLQELEQFRGLNLPLPSSPAVATAPAPSPAPASLVYAAVPPAQAVSPPPAAASPPQRGGARPEKTDPRDGRGSDEPPPAPWSPAPGSATASPGGGFLFAAVASLTMLLIGLMLPALRARLHLPPGGRYTVALVAPLERPG